MIKHIIFVITFISPVLVASQCRIFAQSTGGPNVIDVCFTTSVARSTRDVNVVPTKYMHNPRQGAWVFVRTKWEADMVIHIVECTRINVPKIYLHGVYGGYKYYIPKHRIINCVKM